VVHSSGIARKRPAQWHSSHEFEGVRTHKKAIKGNATKHTTGQHQMRSERRDRATSNAQ